MKKNAAAASNAAADYPSNAAAAVYDATTELNKARGELIKLKALFEPGTAAYAQCEQIDDHLFEVSLKLGE